MGSQRSGRALAAGVLLLHFLAVSVLLPLHALLEPGAGPAGAGRGPVLAAWCPEGDCHDPAHGHGPAHPHDPAACASCAQSGSPALPAPDPATSAPRPLPAGTATRAAAVAVVEHLRPLPRVRGPPLLP